MSDYSFKDGAFVIDQYNQKKTFSNFLPGVAGKKGIPLWAFYVNRAQGIAGFGLDNKNHPIMLFHSANKAYEHVFTDGFRTFIKVAGEIYEPFISSTHKHAMHIHPDSFSIEETNAALKLHIKVTYFGLPNRPVAGLYRHVTLTNLGPKRTIELLDGLAEVIPAGLSTDAFKSLSNLMVSWMEVKGHDQGYAFFKLRGSTGDSAEMNEHQDGNFYVGFNENGRIKPLTDAGLIFGTDTSKRTAEGLIQGVDALEKASQVNVNQVPCAFIPLTVTLETNAATDIVALSGHVSDLHVLEDLLPELSDMTTFYTHQKASKAILDAMLKEVETKTHYPVFDAYVKQNYLDNILRGGYPITFKDQVYHLYARRHGDLERDYNFFSLAPEYYSTGSGNFRDVCQNRRLDPFFNPEVKDFNLFYFASLIGLDGYNPLSVNGVQYRLKDRAVFDACGLKEKDVATFFEHPFTPGSFINYLEANQIPSSLDEHTLLETLLEASEIILSASFSEGYWSDHFTYILDLVESFAGVYPDLMDDTLFKKDQYLYFDSPVRIKKQHETLTQTPDGARQYHALEHPDSEKMTDGRTIHDAVYTRIKDTPYRSNLYIKLLIIVLTKYSLLDPDGYGLEMEAGKPGWNDAMNGLPGLYGSGVSETIELLRIIRFLERYPVQADLTVPEEIHQLFYQLNDLPDYFQRVEIKEAYRDRIRFGLKGDLKPLKASDIKRLLHRLNTYLTGQIEWLVDTYEGLIPTFFTYRVTETKKTGGHTRPSAFKGTPLPTFLEAPARLLKLGLPRAISDKVHTAVLQSELYDSTLKQFKTSVDLTPMSVEAGRIRAFTKGWLERESNFLHMTYKYLLGLLKSGHIDHFDAALKTNLVCFMDPDVYGRSPLENSSFIAPTNNPNPSLHGQGFFARLSGSTIEGLHMWKEMMMGENPFTYEEDLTLRFKPTIPDHFIEDSQISFTFLGAITVTYHADSGLTGASAHTIIIDDNPAKTITGDAITGPLAYDIRNRLVKRIDLYFQ